MASELSQAEQAFDKALSLLDEDEGEKAEALLGLVIDAARVAKDHVLLVRALCVLGEWLHEQGRVAEARHFLREAVEVPVSEPDLVAYEQRRARRILDAPEAT
jgi:tetratricopeptide (TPR) repeat protein